MIDVYTWTTPNGHKIHIMLAETGLPHRIHRVDIGAGQQLTPEFKKINPNGKIPAIVDQDGAPGERSGGEGRGAKPLAVFESGAILVHLAMKSGMLLPSDPTARYATLEWLMFQVSSIGPMFGQAYHFRSAAPERVPYAIDRYSQEVTRILGVMDRRLGEAEYLAGKDYTIADIAAFPWVKGGHNYGQNMEDFPNLGRWIAAIKARPAVQRGFKLLDPK